MERKKTVLHKNYKKNIDLYNEAIEKGCQIEAMVIIFAVIEQVANNMIVRMSSIDEDAYTKVKSKLNKMQSLAYKITTIRSLVSNNKTIREVIGDKEDFKELMNSLNCLDKLRKNYRNDVIHNLMLINLEYKDLLNVNEKAFEIFRVLDKNNKRIKRFVEKKDNVIDASDISKFLDGE